MSKIDFNAMTYEEAKKYFLEHRDDTEAFYAYMDKLHTSGRAIVINPTDPASEAKALTEIRLKVELLERCKSAIGFDGITQCGEAPPEAPKPWYIQRKGKNIYLSAEEAKNYLQNLE